jgi:hypothetical protein
VLGRLRLSVDWRIIDLRHQDVKMAAYAHGEFRN